jgi:AcrR family transcriptional regulator
MTDSVPAFGKGSRSGGRMTKGERTRRHLMDATREVLAEQGYQAMRIEDIAGAADLAKGTFYIYFKNKKAITMAVMEEFLDECSRAMLAARTEDDPFLEILEPTVEYIRLAFENPGLARALLQFCHNAPEAAELWTETTRTWVTKVAGRLARRLGGGAADADTRSLVVYAMNWMVDGVLNSYIVRDDSRLQEVVHSPEQLGETLSVLWYRAVYGEDPNAEQLESARPILDFRLARTS